MRAISCLSLDEGISTVSWAAVMPLRIRVRKSAMGSVIDMGLPARLRHAGDEALVGELAQAHAAEPELPVDRARAATTAAAALRAGRELGPAVGPYDLGCLSHAGVLCLLRLRRGRAR